MKINNLFFHIHYCNSRKGNEPNRTFRKKTRTLNHHELILVTGGNGQIKIGKKEFQIKEGMLFYIGSGVLQTIVLDADDPFCFMSVHFSYAHVGFDEDIWTIGDAKSMLPLQKGQHLQDYYQIEDAFKKLVESWNAKLPRYEFMTKTLFQQLLINIYQSTGKHHQNYATSLKVEKIITFMHQNINSRVTLGQLSDLVQLSPTYLSRTFKEITGYSIIEFFNKLKIDKAKEMILEGDRKIREVAQCLGFTDEFYFSRIFKKLEGISPSEYYSKNVHVI
ncbi:AraC family transcriptional regulator [Paenibacillus sp. NPDC058177]|uniref:AraC family transcriptional regulator n=1 Tax=Paenibacillus sp. NPDC058177 TaxID=3346369 RepID=UPI0036DBDA66